MGGPRFFQNKSQLFSILAFHGHTSQRLNILFSENVTPLSVWTNFVSDLDGKRTSNASQTHQFCELEPGQHDTYIYIAATLRPPNKFEKLVLLIKIASLLGMKKPLGGYGRMILTKF